jgi:serine/threonine protein kinase HipA of HipAB toxin-antitoxin module
MLPLSAAAQTHAPDVAQATRALSAMWRPMSGATTVEQACAGAIEEIEAVEAALPPVLTQQSLAGVHALRGLLVVPTDDPQVAYFFPDRSMSWFASGMGAIAVINETEGFIGVRDAAGQDIAVQLGRGGQHALLRIRNPQGQVLNFVGCAPTSRS